MCEFCENFDFGEARASVEHGFAHIHIAGGSYRFPEHEQFNYCPVCGDRRVVVKKRKRPYTGIEPSRQMFVFAQ